MRKCIIFDIDGTLSDPEHRLHLIQQEPKDWDRFHMGARYDEPITHIMAVAQLIADKVPVICVTGRPELIREMTRDWLDEHHVDYRQLYMRADGDLRQDFIVKQDLLIEVKKDGWDPILVFEDRQQCVDMWRAQGIPCAQVAEGKF